MPGPRVALVHDYLVLAGGAERTFASIARLFPDAPIYTGIHRPNTTLPFFRDRDVRPLWPSRLPLSHTTYRAAFPAYALAFEGLRLDGYDLVVSSSSSFAKSAGAGARTHVAMCYTPPRFIWPMGHSSENAPVTERAVGRAMRPWLRRLDARAASRVSTFVADSGLVRDRIRRFYGREAEVVYPPLLTADVRAGTRTRDGYLVVGRLVPYKVFDLVIEAAVRTGRRLTVVGAGREEHRLRRLGGEGVSFAGVVTDERLADLYATARALIVPGEEDWGMTPLEANAAGCPVVAAARGGALESVVDGVTGVLYDPHQPDAIARALDRFESLEFHPDRLREHAFGFREELFHGRFMDVVDRALARAAA